MKGPRTQRKEMRDQQTERILAFSSPDRLGGPGYESTKRGKKQTNKTEQNRVKQTTKR